MSQGIVTILSFVLTGCIVVCAIVFLKNIFKKH